MQKSFIIKPQQAPKYVTSDGPIYLVDDDREQHRIVAKCYGLSGKKNPLVSFYDGETFLREISLAAESNNSPELVLLDINMPLMDGFAVLGELKKHPKLQAAPAIIMFTASNREEDKKRAKMLKANAYFSKPVGMKDYVDFLREYKLVLCGPKNVSFLSRL